MFENDGFKAVILEDFDILTLYIGAGNVINLIVGFFEFVKGLVFAVNGLVKNDTLDFIVEFLILDTAELDERGNIIPVAFIGFALTVKDRQ